MDVGLVVAIFLHCSLLVSDSTGSAVFTKQRRAGALSARRTPYVGIRGDLPSELPAYERSRPPLTPLTQRQ